MNYYERPPWLKQRITGNMVNVSELLNNLSLNTVCQSASCPNIGECFEARTATFLILGGICTRNCRFCDVLKGIPTKPDIEEPDRLVDAVRKLELKHVVITSVTRDDLYDGGAGHFAQCIRKIRQEFPGVTIEVLIPDFGGNDDSLNLILEAGPEVISHNMETVSRLYSVVRPSADYFRSLNLLQKVSAENKSFVKTGIMLGLGECEYEVLNEFEDLIRSGVKTLTIGQYLRPSKKHLPVAEYITPEKFDWYKEVAYKIGFKKVASGPLVRSSYHAADLYNS